MQAAMPQSVDVLVQALRDISSLRTALHDMVVTIGDRAS